MAITQKNTSVKEKYSEISSSVQETKLKIKDLTDIKTVILEQGNEIQHVLTNLAAITEENAASTEEVSASIVEQTDKQKHINAKMIELENMVKSLDELMNHFKI